MFVKKFRWSFIYGKERSKNGLMGSWTFASLTLKYHLSIRGFFLSRQGLNHINSDLHPLKSVT